MKKRQKRPSRARLFDGGKQVRLRTCHLHARALQTAGPSRRRQALHVRFAGIDIDRDRHAGCLHADPRQVEAGFAGVLEQGHILVAMLADRER